MPIQIISWALVWPEKGHLMCIDVIILELGLRFLYLSQENAYIQK